jgi:exodeoxyribonuclease VII large subunit
MSDETPLRNLPEFSVSEISNLLKRTVEDAFPYVRVKGELGRVNRHSSGHCYFDLKDDRAVISAVIWKTAFARLKVAPEQGLEVICTGRITTFPGQSKYQLVVEQVELAGLGALMAMLEERKRRLAGEGLFDAARKKPLPFLPNVVGVITSPTGAVIRDIMHRLADRCPRRVLLWPVTVQGERAPAEIVAAIRGFNAASGRFRPDVLIVARGGGSFEDLIGFSDEAVVRAAAASEIPLISAVGHETDTTLIDFASDRRAPTPTAAAEMAVPVIRELVGAVLDLNQRLHRCSSRGLEHRRRTLQALARALPRADALLALGRQRFDAAADRLRGALFQNLQRHASQFQRSAGLLRPRLLSAEIAQRRDEVLNLEVQMRAGLTMSLQRHRARLNRGADLLRPRLIHAEIAQGRDALRALDARLDRAYRQGVRKAADSLDGCGRVLESVSYRAVLTRGFALVRGADRQLRRRAAAIRPGEKLALIFADNAVAARSEGKPAKPAQILDSLKRQGELF